MSDEAFSNHVDEVKRIVSTLGTVRIVMYSAGEGGPNAKQRALLRPVASLPFRFVLITDSPAMRAIMTAISWFMRQPIRAFSTHAAAGLLDFLELDAGERAIVRRLLKEVCAEGGFPEPKL